MRLPSSTLKEVMMSISDAEILDVVRRLRQYVTTLDNCHLVLDKLSKINDESIKTNVKALIPELIIAGSKTATTLKNIEASKSYRDMLKKFHIDDNKDV